MRDHGAGCDAEAPIVTCLQNNNGGFTGYGGAGGIPQLHVTGGIGDYGTPQRRATANDFGHYFITGAERARTLYGHKKVYDVVEGTNGEYRVKICLRNCGNYQKILGREFAS